MADEDIYFAVFDAITGEAKPGNDAHFYTDNRKLYSAMLDDLRISDGKDDFVYMANWWCDIDIPLGDPFANPRPPLLRDVLTQISRNKREPNINISQYSIPLIPGAQICAMLWRHKNQKNWHGLPSAILSLPASIFGDPLLAEINTIAFKHINSLDSDSCAILDGDHLLLGSHHQKFLIIKNKTGLVAYIGSADFNADRIYPKGSNQAKNPPTTNGAPLEDIAIRITGPVAGDVLKTFVSRWNLHSKGKSHPLRGDGYSPPLVSVGNLKAQVTHTYGANYPYKNQAVHSASFAIQNVIDSAQRYIYFEDQYLIGTDALYKSIQRKLNTSIKVDIIAVMAPLDVADDLPLLKERRSEFWYPLVEAFPTRIKLFEMTNIQGSTSGDGSYLHSKLVIADDIIVSVGSVNCSNRSWYHDSEILLSVSGEMKENKAPRSFATQVRLERWSRHLGLTKRELLKVNESIAKWSPLPISALVRRWTPQKIVLSPKEKYAFEHWVDPKA
ncbi:phospholipase D-like domain-containing protein [Bacillus sp. 1813sda1]|nr:phospholipase D-like domain-containing protein [Bacillus sp. 1813sda1]MCP1166804.1 phospholipase D-like domain-containing protein [Bacillus sp. 1813sda1]